MFDTLDRISQLREERGWSLYRVAKEAGVPQSTMATWYSRRINPPVEVIEKICRSFDMTLSEFFAGQDQDTFVSAISRRRKEMGLSQKELAAKAGISVETVSAYEQGKRDICLAQYRIVKNLADALECRPEDIT